MTISRKIAQIVIAFLITFATVIGLYLVGSMRAAESHADVAGYYNRLNDAGYYGTRGAWSAIGTTICNMEMYGTDRDIIALWVVGNTGANVYMADAYEIIGIANIELCGGAGTLT